ncbi:bifunctional serine/threonine-protein kinase/transporter substrate-binding domain-containing protein [Embleya sp. NPDC059213]|uniref:bifunctional serine/threonine-protein kinase/transporter substrate-binding domain-containing protein n=2 Tax=unclassified Embleya TaxID=2699296 RepID=UPI00369EB326
MVDAVEAQDPQRIGSFAVLGRLGAGGMGRVFLARSPGGRLVAVKTVHAELAADPHFRRRFAAEIAAMRRIGGFWTAAFVDADAEAETPWLATEYLTGPSLTQAVTAHGPLPESSARLLAAGLAESLTAIHAVGLVHRDLKPSNVLLTADGPRVIDFGIARQVHGTSELTRTGHLVGSPGFLSPEQARGDEVGPASDVFAVGLVLTYATAGVPAFGTGDPAQLLFRVVYEEPRLDAVPAGLRPLVAACLRKDPAERPTPERLLELLGESARPAADDWLPAAHSALVRNRPGETGPTEAGATEAGPTEAGAGGVPPTYPRQPPEAVAGAPTAPAGPVPPPPGPVRAPAAVPPPPRPARAPVPGWSPVPDQAPAVPFAPVTKDSGMPRRRLLIGGSVVAAALAGGSAYLFTRDEGGRTGAVANKESPGASSPGNKVSGGAPGANGSQPPVGSGVNTGAPSAGLLPEKYRNGQPLAVGVDAAYPPNEFLDADGRTVIGMTADLAKAIGEQLGVALELRPSTFDALVPALKSGRIDLIMSSMVDTPARRADGIDFVDYFRAGTAILVAKDNPRRIQGLSDLCGCRVVILKGAFQDDLATEAGGKCGSGGGVTKVGVATMVEATTRIRQGEADAGLFDYPAAVYAARNSADGLRVAQGQIEAEPYGIAFRNTDPQLRDAVRQALERLIAAGEYRRIVDRWQLSEGAVSKVTVNGG